jgi:hypothetical protein
VEREHGESRCPITPTHQNRQGPQQRAVRSERTRRSSNYRQLCLKWNSFDRGFHHAESLLSRQPPIPSPCHPCDPLDRSIWIRSHRSISSPHRRQCRVGLLVSDSVIIAVAEPSLVRLTNFQEVEVVLVRVRFHVDIPNHSWLYVSLAQLGLHTLSRRNACYGCQSIDTHQHLWRFVE